MLCANTRWIRNFAALAVFTVVFAFSGPRAKADPPTTIPAGGPPGHDPYAIEYNGWQVYPSINFLAENSNNYYLSPGPKISGWQFGVAPTMTAEWSNGIHTTTLFGNLQLLENPTDKEVDQTNGEATWTQVYAPLRDLNFTVSGDYIHQTIASGLTNAIPAPTAFTGTTVLPNGNLQLPNGTIVSPTGQVVGQATAAPNVGQFSIVNPYDLYTATAKALKYFGDGILTVGGSIARQSYEQTSTSPDTSAKTITEDSAYWLGSLFYAYSDGAFTWRTTDQNPNSTAYRIVGGIGTRQFGLFRVSSYFGYQGTGTAGVGPSGGYVYGGALTYYPTPLLTLTAMVDETINHAPANAPASTLALGVPVIIPVQIATSSSVQITGVGLHSAYTITPQWTADAFFTFTRLQYLGSQAWTNTWVADASLSYVIWRNLTLRWEYQFSSIVSDVPQTSASRNLIQMGTSYRF